MTLRLSAGWALALGLAPILAVLPQSGSEGDSLPTPTALAAAPADSAVHGARFDLACGRCHVPSGWRELRPDLEFEHAATGYPLRGAHAQARCRDCHRDLVFSRVGVRCADCHEDVLHHGELGTECARCHDERGWRHSAKELVEHAQTRFPLLGRHALVDCATCHRQSGFDEYRGLPVACAQCHAGDYAGAQTPDHRRLGFSTACEDCHSAADLRWADSAFRHPNDFPLAFGHDVRDCNLCHTSAAPVPDGDHCFGCHAADYAGTTHPAHAAAGFSTACRECHETTRFAEVRSYDHAASGYRLQGAHADQLCFACHWQGVYAGRPTDCYSCHSLDYQLAREPDHRRQDFSTDCSACHSAADSDWRSAGGYAHTLSGFPFVGAHARQPCGACHGSGVYAGLPAECVDCHRDDYDRTRFPIHVRAGYSTDCALCHTPEGWDTDARFGERDALCPGNDRLRPDGDARRAAGRRP